MQNIYQIGLVWSRDRKQTKKQITFENGTVFFAETNYLIDSSKKFLEENVGSLKDYEISYLLKGMLEGAGDIILSEDGLVVQVEPHPSVVDKIITLKGGCFSHGKIQWIDHEAIDLLGDLYSLQCETVDGFHEKYTRALRHQEHSFEIKVCKTKHNAVLPFKVRSSDAGYDITLIELISQKKNIFMYDTGIQVQPPFGWYFDLVPRSSLSKSGYMLANSVGIIDPTYRGNIKVALYRVDPEAEPLILPGRYCQLIPRQITHFNIKAVDELNETSRADGGFGSTNTIGKQ